MLPKKIINAYPSSSWRNATPVGNGRLGASICGSIFDERILLNHEELYSGGRYKEIPDISSSLAEVRRLMDEKKYLEAEHFYTKALKEKGYFANKGSFFPAFDLRIRYGINGIFEDYSRELDLVTGISSIIFEEDKHKVTRECFASFKDRFIVIHIEKDVPFTIAFALQNHSEEDMKDYNGNHCNFIDAFDTKSIDRYVYAYSRSVHGLEYAGIAKVLSTDGNIIANGHDKTISIDMSGEEPLHNYIRVENATNVTILVNIEKEKLSCEENKKIIDSVDMPYEELKERHKKEFSELFGRVELDIAGNSNNASNEQLFLDGYSGKTDLRLIEKMADFGRYLLISSSYNCHCPANLQGLWNGDYSPAWACTFFNNENLEMNYWQAFEGNLLECLLPMFDFFERFMDDYRENAQKLFSCRGILLPLFMDNQSGKKDNLQPHVLYWTGSSSWISSLYFDYYLYTSDESFLLNRAYPFMKEAALFYEDFMVIDPKTGLLKSYPADSPENHAKGDFIGAEEISISINPTMDFALLKKLLKNLIFTAEKFSLDNDKVEAWKKMMDSIPPYEINSDGAIKEWMHGDFEDNYRHRHLSHIFPLFPCGEIGKDDKELFAAIKVAVNKRLAIGLKEQTGWSFSHMANIYDRLGEGDKALECLENIIKFCTGENLYTHHNDWRNMGVTLKYSINGYAPFQIDANMGFTSAIYGMFVESSEDRITIFPAKPSSFKKGSVKGIRAKGGYTVDISFDEDSVDVSIKDENHKPVSVFIEGYMDKPIILDFINGDLERMHYEK